MIATLAPWTPSTALALPRQSPLDPPPADPGADRLDLSPEATALMQAAPERPTARIRRNGSVVGALRSAGYTNREIREHGLIDRVASLNGLKNANMVHPGQVLVLPAREEMGLPAAAPRPRTQGPSAPPPSGPHPKPLAQRDGEIAIPDYGPNPTREQLAEQLEAAGRKYGIDPDLLKAVAWKESTWRPRARSFDGGHGKGVMQIDDRYHLFARTKAVWNPARNIDYGARYLRTLHRQHGSWDKALAAYNGSRRYPGQVYRLMASRPWQ